MKELSFETPIYVYDLSTNCSNCNKSLVKNKVLLKYESMYSSRLQEENLLYCSECNRYYIDILNMNKFKRKYSNYIIIENEENVFKDNPLEVYRLDKNENHIKCNNKERYKDYDLVYEELIIQYDDNKLIKKVLNKCQNCKRIFATDEEIKDIQAIYKNIKINYEIATKKVKKKGKKKRIKKKIDNTELYKDGIVTFLNEYSKLNVLSKNTCDSHEKVLMTINVKCDFDGKSSIIRKINGAYCKECNMYIVDEKDFKNKFKNCYINCDLLFDGIKSKNDFNNENYYLIHKNKFYKMYIS